MERKHEGLLISADSHVVEPADFFDPLKEQFGEDAPQMVVRDPARGPQVYVGPADYGATAAGFLQTCTDFTSPIAQEEMRHGYDLGRPGCWDAAARMQDMDDDGVNAEVIYPSLMFSLFRHQRIDILEATFQLYNDWVVEQCKEYPQRMFPLACLHVRNVDGAVAELLRCKKNGHVGACIATTAPPECRYRDPTYDRLWAVAQDLNMSLSMHMLTGATPWHGLPFQAADNELSFAGVMFTIHDLIWSGVCERFPRLKFVVTEFEAGWVAIMLKRMDWIYTRRGGARHFGFPLKPSEYWKRQFYVTFEDDPLGILTREHIGTNTMMWGSDYPHGDTVFPASCAILADVLSDCSADEVFQLTVANAVNLYDLPFKVDGSTQSAVANRIKRNKETKSG